MLASLAILCFVKFMNAQIGVTTCTADGIECVSLPNSICDKFNTLKCVCPADHQYHQYQEKPDKSGCDYNCGFPMEPANGAVEITGTLQSSTALYKCSEGFKLTGGSNRTCIVGIGWSGVMPTCVEVVEWKTGTCLM
ncbi:seizure protein 6 homolog [Dreissena polymorpha]|uniref:seizure protein 6 homolog n=1 Tax=Dreissena polymorpha TaxID=45954 RepID=UPI00226494D4|nr:seizure protein 6 homolog [Dreissena polymorpha]